MTRHHNRLMKFFKYTSLRVWDIYETLFPGLVTGCYLIDKTRGLVLLRPTGPNWEPALVSATPNDIHQVLGCSQKTDCKSLDVLLSALPNDRRHVFHTWSLGRQIGNTTFVLRLDKSTTSLFPTTSMVTLELFGQANFPAYLFWVIGNRFLNEVLIDPNTNATLLTNRELLENASAWYLGSWSESLKCNTRLPSLHETFDNISLLPYEGRRATGTIVLLPSSIKSSRFVTFERPVPLDDYRSVRKLLEASAQGSALACDGNVLYGIGDLPKTLPTGVEPFVIAFTGRHKWHVAKLSSGQRLTTYFEVKDGVPTMARPPITLKTFTDTFVSVFKALTPTQARNLWGIATNLIEARHAALLVVDLYASAEANRLRQQAFPILPTSIQPGLLTELCHIDGAILMDLDGACHAFGAILDGHASANQGDPSRGSRYNSAIRYVQSRSGMAIALVISEDGYIDFVK